MCSSLGSGMVASAVAPGTSVTSASEPGLPCLASTAVGATFPGTSGGSAVSRRLGHMSLHAVTTGPAVSTGAETKSLTSSADPIN